METKEIRLPVANENKFDFVPSTPEEKIHLEKLNELLNKKRRGDWELVAEMCGISKRNSEQSFKRVHSIHHLSVVDALTKVIQTRNLLLTK